MVTGDYQINGVVDITKPDNTPLKMPKRPFSLKQKQVILNWRYGVPPTYGRPINSVSAIAQQLKVKLTTAFQVIKKFERDGFRNTKSVKKRGAGRKRTLIKDADTEAKILSDEVMNVMAPMSLRGRVNYI